MVNKAIFLDRDGVLNHAIIRDGLPFAPTTVEECEIVPDAASALKLLKAQDYLLIVVTNQPDVARGKSTQSTVDAINQKLQDALPLDEFRVCFHDDNDHCLCRKPLPGLLLAAGQAHAIDMAQSYMIGDRWKDVEAGRAAGCKTILIANDYAERRPEYPADFIVTSLTEAVTIISF